METKLFELRDRATFVPVLCVKMVSDQGVENYLLRRSGYGEPFDLIVMTGLAGGMDKATCDPYDWGINRTRLICHQYIQAHWNELASGDVVDAEFIAGESEQPKQSERITAP